MTDYPCRRCGRTEVEKWGLCMVCVDWWMELVTQAAEVGVEWDIENTEQVGLST